MFTFSSFLVLKTLNKFINFGHTTLSFTLIKNFKCCGYIDQKQNHKKMFNQFGNGFVLDVRHVHYVNPAFWF